ADARVRGGERGGRERRRHPRGRRDAPRTPGRSRPRAQRPDLGRVARGGERRRRGDVQELAPEDRGGPGKELQHCDAGQDEQRTPVPERDGRAVEGNSAALWRGTRDGLTAGRFLLDLRKRRSRDTAGTRDGLVGATRGLSLWSLSPLSVTI